MKIQVTLCTEVYRGDYSDPVRHAIEVEGEVTVNELVQHLLKNGGSPNYDDWVEIRFCKPLIDEEEF